jgi:hypothetical protein
MALSAAVRNMPTMSFEFDYEYVNVLRPTQGTPNEYNEPTITWPASESNIKADIQPISMVSANVVKQLLMGTSAESSHIIFLETGKDIKPGDRVEDDNDNLYEVDAVREWHSHMEAALSITGLDE